MKAVARLMIRFYQVAISPFLGVNCRFEPTCSNYALQCFEKFSFFTAIWYSIRRLLRCHPFCQAGFDPVP